MRMLNENDGDLRLSEICFDTSSWSVVDNKMPLDLGDLGILEKRKMSVATKMIWVATRHLIGEYPILFASNYGEVARCFALLSNLNRENIVSPNAFSHSVLNANIAHCAILKGYHGTINAISAKAALEVACLVGFANLKWANKVCIVVYEEDYYKGESYCVAFLMSKGNSTRLEVLGKPKCIKGCPVYDLSLKNFIHLRFELESRHFILKDDDMGYFWSFDESI